MRKLSALVLLLGSAAIGSELRFAIHADVKTFNPLLVEDEPSQAVRYLTGGVLLRVNRLTQQLEPDLAASWKVHDGGRKITFALRSGVKFSDGTPFSSEDVAGTFRMLMDPALHSATGDSFRSSAGGVTAETAGPTRVTITFPAPVSGAERLFDQVAILPASSPNKEKAVLGPFMLREHKAGSYVLLERNPNYWKKDAAGRRLPYLDSIRLEVVQNRDFELLRFRRGELHLINTLDAELYDRVAAEMPAAARDAGPSLDVDFLWFNQVAAAPLPEHKKAWFRSAAFRRAISEAINREDLCRVVYRGKARPAAGPVSSANRLWFNTGLKPQVLDLPAALRRLESDGFRREGSTLRDRAGNPVEFSLITNAGNKARERMAAMIQQDLAQIGVKLNIVTLDFPSLIERISRSFRYEACLLGFTNVEPDPNGQMNVWLSSSSNHAWNPGQKSPATPWEAEIDKLMREQASAPGAARRKAAFDRVQQIVWEQAPFLYLVHRNALSAISPQVKNASPAVLTPQTYWNIDHLDLSKEVAARQ